MNPCIIPPAEKKPRALPKRWQRFFYLNNGDVFSIGRCSYVKTGFFTAVHGDRAIHLPPWRRVQSSVLVRDARPGGKSSFVVTEEARPQPVNDGITHFAPDVTCSGGHADPPVNNDNNISGTSS